MELASRLKEWVGTRLEDVSVKDEHKGYLYYHYIFLYLYIFLYN